MEIFDGDEDFQIPLQDKLTKSSFHLYILRIKKSGSLDRKVVFEKLRNNAVYVNIHYIPIYKQPFYSNNYLIKDFPNAESYYEEAISLPIFPNLSDKDIIKIAEIIKNPANYQNIF